MHACECRELTSEDYETDIVPVLQRHPDVFKGKDLTLAAFRNAASWVGSRAFGINAYHGTTAVLTSTQTVTDQCLTPGMALMPLADAFNHKAAKVKMSGDFEIAPLCQASDSDSSSAAGALSAACCPLPEALLDTRAGCRL